MPAPRVPLFHPRTVRDCLARHVFPADLAERHARVLDWVKTLKSGALDGAKEVELHGQFLEQMFSEVLGYRGRVQSGGAGWELNPEKTVSADGKSADAAIGFFSLESQEVFAPVELKSARQSLDSAGSRALTPVQQAWEYAQYTPGSRYVIVSNYRETRLYSKSRTPDEFEVFLLEDLAQEDAFRRFYLLLGRENLLPAKPGQRSLVDEMLVQSTQVEAEVTSAVYTEYRALRVHLYEHLCKVHSNLPRRELIAHTQKILDRILFIAFAEKRELLPVDTLADAIEQRDRYEPRPVWRNLVAVFRWIDRGNVDPKIAAYNGGLFRPDAEIDELEVSDAVCLEFLRFAQHDFREEISLDVIGHIFEQSITDLEDMRAEADEEARKVSKRKTEGVYYTPSFITRFIVEETLGRALRLRWDAILARMNPDAERAGKKRDARWIDAWEAYREELKGLHVLDLACGSGAFLIAAFDRLAREYELVNASLASLRGGQVTIFDLTRTVLNANLFGVDLNRESVELTKLSLWLKTAQTGQRLTDLDRNIKWGNSVVDDVTVDPLAFDWSAGTSSPDTMLQGPAATADEAAIDARWRGKFDVVVGNPPYVRHERLASSKPHWQAKFKTWQGTADLYVYFFERALQVLEDGGRLGFIVANKWLRAGYADKLRGLLAAETTIETFVDFGHAPIFPDADAFPCVVTLVKAKPGEGASLDMTQFPRELLGETDVAEYVKRNRYPVPQRRLGSEGWSLEPVEVEALLEKIRDAGVPLVEYAGVKPYYGVKTGFNDAFLVDSATKERLVREDPGSAELLKKYLRGEDVARWSPEWAGQWMIFARRGVDIDRYPAIKAHLEGFRQALEPRPADWKPTEQEREWPGRKPGSYAWFEIQDSVDYWPLFEQPKLVIQRIAFHSRFSCDQVGHFINDSAIALPSTDAWMMACLNSPALWSLFFRILPHKKDEALAMDIPFVERFPIVRPSPAARDLAETLVPKLVTSVRENQAARRLLRDSLRLQYGVETPGQKLDDPASLDGDAFVREVLARRPGGSKKSGQKISAAELQALQDLFAEVVVPMQARRRASAGLERQLAQTVNDAYGLTPVDVDTLWRTAPPRMPVGR